MQVECVINVTRPHYCVISFTSVKHRGEIVNKAIRESGYKVTSLAKRMGHSRKTLYRRLEEPNLNYDYIIDLYKVIKRNPTKDFPELSKYISHDLESYSEEDDSIYLNKNPEEELKKCKEELNELRAEFIRVVKERDALRNRQTG